MSEPSYGPLDYIGYEHCRDIRGDSWMRAKFVVNTADANYYEGVLLQALGSSQDGLAYLQCVAVTFRYLNNDAETGKVELTAEFIPSWKLICLLPNSPFYIRWEISSESFTIPPVNKDATFLWKWEGDADTTPIANIAVLPIKRVAVVNIVLYGTRTTFNASTYSTYEDKLNSDTFLGFTAEHLAFIGASASHRMLETGVMTNDVEIRLKGRWIAGWNSEWDEKSGTFKRIVKVGGSGATIAETTSFSGLTTAS